MNNWGYTSSNFAIGPLPSIVAVLLAMVTILTVVLIYEIETHRVTEYSLSRKTLNAALESCSPNGGLLKIGVGLKRSTVTCHNNMTITISNQ